MPRAFDPRAGERALFEALLDARDRYGAKKPILEDQERKPLTYTDLVRASFALGRKIAAMTQPGERVGVLLPSSAGVIILPFILKNTFMVPTSSTYFFSIPSSQST